MHNKKTPISSLALALAALFVAPMASAQDAPVAEEAPAETPIEAPELLTSVEAPFPEGAWDAEVEADVIVELELDETGAVRSVTPVAVTLYTYDDEGYLVETPVASLPDTWGFIDAATAAAAQYTFSPAYRWIEGERQAVPVRLTWQIGFVAEYATDDTVDEDAVGEPTDEPTAERDEVRPTAQPGEHATLSGQLLERGTRTPLGMLAVNLTNEAGVTQTVFTDAEGGFSAEGLDAGVWRVTIAEPAYEAVSVSETLEAGEELTVRYYVERERYGENVSRTTASPIRREVTRRDVTMTEIQRAPGTANDALRVVLSMPGVNRSAFDSGEIVMRGSESSDNTYMLDGLPMPLLYHFGGLRSIFPSELLGELQVTPGGFGAYYGDATGGVVHARTRDAADAHHGHIDVNVIDTGLFFEGPISERLSYQVGARRSYADVVLAAVDDAMGGLRVTRAPVYYDAQARLTWEASRDHTVSLLAFTNSDAFAFTETDEREVPPEQRGGLDLGVDFRGVQVHVDSQLGDRTTNTLGVQYLALRQDNSFGHLQVDAVADGIQYRDTLTWQSPEERLTLQGGVDGNVERWDWDVVAPRIQGEGEVLENPFTADTYETQETQWVTDAGAFASAGWQASDALTLTPSARLQYFSMHDMFAFDPRFLARAELSDVFALKGSVGRYHRSLEGPEISVVFGNPDQTPEVATHYVLGTEYQLAANLRFETDFFYKDMDDLSVASDDIVTRDGEEVREMVDNDGAGRSYGAELLLRHDATDRFFGWISYGISRSERQDGPGEAWRAFDYDQTHVLTALGSYQLRRGWSLGFRYRFVSGNPMTEIIGGTFDAESNVYQPVTPGINTARMPDFHQLDVRVDKRWVFDTWHLNAYLDLQNATNRANVEGYLFNYDYTESEPMTGLPIIPSFGLRGAF